MITFVNGICSTYILKDVRHVYFLIGNSVNDICFERISLSINNIHYSFDSFILVGLSIINDSEFLPADGYLANDLNIHENNRRDSDSVDQNWYARSFGYGQGSGRHLNLELIKSRLVSIKNLKTVFNKKIKMKKEKKLALSLFTLNEISLPFQLSLMVETS